MVNKFFTWIGKLFNWLPILHVSSDSDFGSFDGNKTDTRFSLLTLSLGQNKYYFLSIYKSDSGWMFDFFKRLDFFDVCPIYTLAEVDEKGNKYELDLEPIKEDSDKLKLHVELLKEKITQNRTRISSSYTKLNSYRSIILALAAAGVYVLTETVNSQVKSNFVVASWFFLVLFVLYSLSAFLQVTFALKVKAYIKSAFKDLKESTSVLQLAKCFYVDFISLGNESRIVVSITKNAEKYFNRCFIVLIISWLCIFSSQSNFFYNRSLFSYKENEYLIVDSQGQLQLKQLAKFIDSLDAYNGKVYVISHEADQRAINLVDFLNKELSERVIFEPISIQNNALKSGVVVFKYGVDR